MAYRPLKVYYAKAILLEEQRSYNLTHYWEDKGVHTFPKSICLKVNVIARVDFELAYYDSAVHRVNHYNTKAPAKTELPRPIDFERTLNYIIPISISFLFRFTLLFLFYWSRSIFLLV